MSKIKNILNKSKTSKKDELVDFNIISSDVVSNNVGNEVSLEFLECLLFNDEYFLHVNKLINNEITNISVQNNLDNKIYKYSLVDLIEFLIIAVKLNKIALDEERKKIYEYLLYETSVNKFKIDYEKYEYKKCVDNITYTIDFSDIIEFIFLDEEKFKKFLKTENRNKYLGFDKVLFVYLVNSFILSNNVLSRYKFPFNIETRINLLLENSLIDTSFFNKIIDTKDENLTSITVNSELRKQILNGMPEDFSTLEKSIYIYIKMCKILSYDDEYYLELKSKVAKKHETIENLSYITKENNKVVCYEFSAIFGKLLSELDISFETESTSVDGYGKGHTTTNYRVGNFLVSADSVTSVVDGDLARSKLGLSLRGLNCENSNKDTVLSFQKILAKVYKFVNNNDALYIKNFETSLAEYKEIQNPNFIDKSLTKKFQIFINLINQYNLEGIDIISFAFYARKLIFNEYEMNECVFISTIRNASPLNKNQISEMNLIISFSNPLSYDDYEMQYFLLKSDGELSFISFRELKNKFYSKEFKYTIDNRQIIFALEERQNFSSK